MTPEEEYVARCKGPVFPSETDRDFHLGISLRDHIAITAMEATAHEFDPRYEWNDKRADALADQSYRIADAMLKRREVRP